MVLKSLTLLLVYFASFRSLSRSESPVTEAVTEQMQTLDYASPFNSAHNRSFEFAEKLAAKLPDDINSIFFANSGLKLF